MMIKLVSWQLLLFCGYRVSPADKSPGSFMCVLLFHVGFHITQNQCPFLSGLQLTQGLINNYSLRSQLTYYMQLVDRVWDWFREYEMRKIVVIEINLLLSYHAHMPNVLVYFVHAYATMNINGKFFEKLTNCAGLGQPACLCPGFCVWLGCLPNFHGSVVFQFLF